MIRGARLGAGARDAVVAFLAFLLLACLQSPGLIAPDTKYDLVAAPGRFLATTARLLSLWRDSRDDVPSTANVGAHVADVVARTRAAGAQRVCVGLGVSNGAQAREIGAYADGVIVGSALVKTLFDEDIDRGLKALGELATELKSGVSGARA